MADHRHAARRVFDIVELLENILLRVDLQTLLLAQRVDKTFHATINHSKPLQESLFLRIPTTPSTGDDRLGLLSDHRMKSRIAIHRVSGTYDGISNYSIIFGTAEQIAALPTNGSFRRMHIMRPKPGRAVEKWAVSYRIYDHVKRDYATCRVGVKEFTGVPTVGELLDVVGEFLSEVGSRAVGKKGGKQAAKTETAKGGRKVDCVALKKKQDGKAG